MKPFKFKQFTVHQDKTAMKIGTDGVLLGAVTALSAETDAVLDIGAGTGVVALMLAQRSQAMQIDAIELDGDAYEQCVDNFEASPWGDRLFCYHASFQEFYEEMDEQYDLIVCNPPYFKEDNSSGDPARDRARQNEALPYEELFQGVQKLLSKSGHFSVIIPFSLEAHVRELAVATRLFPFKVLRIKGNPEAPIKRCILEFSRKEQKVSEEELVIETGRHQYTAAYCAFTKDFYLKM